MECKTCKKREVCNQICESIEQELGKLNHSLKSKWRVTFHDPAILEVIAHVQKTTYREFITHKEKHRKHRRRLVVLVKRLTKRQRQCTVFYYGLTTGEPISQPKIARRLGVKPNTVSKTLTRAMTNLRRMFSEKKT